MLYGGISQGDIRKQHEARSSMFNRIEQLALAKGDRLPISDKQRYGQYVKGFNDINGLRERLGSVSEHLMKFAPKVDDGYANPEFETDWHDRLLDLGISALKSGITSVLTIGSGRGEIFGAWKGLGVEQQGHNLGHMKQPNNPIWVKIRQYNSRMLVKLMQELKVYQKVVANDGQHSYCLHQQIISTPQARLGRLCYLVIMTVLSRRLFYSARWKTSHQRRLYTSILRASGINVDRFNMLRRWQPSLTRALVRSKRF